MTDLTKAAPRLISYPELRAKLLPFVKDWPWGEDTIYDLWLLGAPVPQDRCPKGCASINGAICGHIRRVLLPTMFEKWWSEVAERQALEVGAKILYSDLGKFS